MPRTEKIKEKTDITEGETPEPQETPPTIEFPQVAGNGRFQAISLGAGYVVYNPAGQRVTEIVSFTQAGDIVRAQNQAAHLKG